MTRRRRALWYRSSHRFLASNASRRWPSRHGGAVFLLPHFHASTRHGRQRQPAHLSSDRVGAARTLGGAAKPPPSVSACWHSPGAHTVRVRKLLLTCVPIAIALVLMQLRSHVINGLFPCDIGAEPEPEPEQAEPEPTLYDDACAGRKRFFEGELNELVSALLSVFGIVYGLAVSQTSAACAARNDNFRECIFNEAACMKRIALLVQSNLDNAASRESELLRVSVTPEALPEPNTNGEQRRTLAVAVKHSLENHALVLWDDFVLAMNPYRHCRRVHNRKEAASEDKDALEKLANAVITLGRLSSQAEDIAGARAAERAEEACWELMKENHRRKGALTPWTHSTLRATEAACCSPRSPPTRDAGMISDPILTTMTLLYLASLSGCMFFGVLMLESGSRASTSRCASSPWSSSSCRTRSFSAATRRSRATASTSRTTPTSRSGCRCTRSRTRGGSARAPSTRTASRSCCGRKRRARVRPRRRRRRRVHAEHPPESDRHAGAELRRRAARPLSAELRHVCVDQILTRLYNIDSHYALLQGKRTSGGSWCRRRGGVSRGGGRRRRRRRRPSAARAALAASYSAAAAGRAPRYWRRAPRGTPRARLRSFSTRASSSATPSEPPSAAAAAAAASAAGGSAAAAGGGGGDGSEGCFRGCSIASCS